MLSKPDYAKEQWPEMQEKLGFAALHVGDSLNQFLGVTKAGCFKPGCLQVVLTAPLRTFYAFGVPAFPTFWAHLRSFALF